MKMESAFINPSEISSGGSKKLEALSVQEKIKTLRDEIAGLTKKDKDISTGKEGFRVKVPGKTDAIELEILKKEDEIRSLEKELSVIPKKREAENLREEIKKLEKEYKDRITGVAGFRDLDKKEDPIEAKILEKEAKLRSLESEINGVKKEKAQSVEPAVKKENAIKDADDNFIYNGASEGFTLNKEESVGSKDEISKIKGVDRLTEVGTEGTENILDSENIPKNSGVSRLTEVGTEGTEPVLDSENMPKPEIAEDPNKFGSEGENIEGRLNGMNPSEFGSTEFRIDKLKKEIDLSRKEYLEIDYKKNTALSRVRKFFGNIGKYENEKSRYQDPELAEYRAHYDAKLMELQKLELSSAKERGASDEELSNLFKEFGVEQRITMESEHDKVKIEQQEGSFKGFLGEKVTEISKKYQAWPLKTKLGIGAAFMAGGLAVGSAGAILGGVFVGAATARKIVMGMITGVGTTLALEARGQMKDKKKVERDRVEFLEKIKNMTEEEKAHFLNSQLDGIIKDDENKIDNIKNRDILQKGTGVAVGFSSIMAGMFGKEIWYGISDHFGWGKPDVIPVPVKPPIQPVEIPNPSFSEEVLKINGSVEKTLIQELKSHGIKDPGGEAHRMVLKFMEERGIDEPNLVYDNNNITIESDGKGGFLLKEIGGDGKWGHSDIIEARVNGQNNIVNSNVISRPDDVIPSPDVPIDKIPKLNVPPASIPPGISPEILNDADHEFQKIETEYKVEGTVKELGAKIDAENMRVDQEVSMEEFNADTFNDRNELLKMKSQSVDLLNNLRTEDVPWEGKSDIAELLANNAGSHQILHSSLDKLATGQSMDKLAYWREIKDAPINKILFTQMDAEKNPSMKLMREFQKIIGNDAVPKQGLNGEYETTKTWLARVTNLALKAKK